MAREKPPTNVIQTFSGHVIKGNLKQLHYEFNVIFSEQFRLLHLGKKPKYWEKTHTLKNSGFVVDGRSNPGEYSRIFDKHNSGKAKASALIEKMEKGHEAKIDKTQKLLALKKAFKAIESNSPEEEIILALEEVKNTEPFSKEKDQSLIQRVKGIFSAFGDPTKQFKFAKKTLGSELKAVADKLSKQIADAEVFVSSDKIEKPLLKQKDQTYMSVFNRVLQNSAGDRARSLHECRLLHKAEREAAEKLLNDLLNSERYLQYKPAVDEIRKFFADRINEKTSANNRRIKWAKYGTFLVQTILPKVQPETEEQTIQKVVNDAENASRPVDVIFDRFPILKTLDQMSKDIYDLRRASQKKPYRFKDVHPERSPGYAAWTGPVNGVESVKLRKEASKYILDMVLKTTKGNPVCIAVSIDPRLGRSFELAHWIDSWYDKDGKIRKIAQQMPLEITLSCKIKYLKKNREKIDTNKPYVSFAMTRPLKARVIELNGFESKISMPSINIIGHNSDEKVGFVVDQIIGSPNGLLKGDTVVAFFNCQGKKVDLMKNKGYANQICNNLSYRRPGSSITFIVMRNGVETSVNVPLKNGPLIACDMSQGVNYPVAIMPDGKIHVGKISLNPKDCNAAYIGRHIEDSSNKRDLGISLKNRVLFNRGNSEHQRRYGGRLSYKAHKSLKNARLVSARTLAAKYADCVESFGGSYLIVEELDTKITGDNFRKQNVYAANWNRSEIAKAIKQVCAVRGIHLITISPYLTSKVCSVCIAKGQRGFVWRYSIRNKEPKGCKTGKSGICTTCGSELHPDVNASVNIAYAYQGKLQDIRDEYRQMSERERSDFWIDIEEEAKKILRTRNPEQLEDFVVPRT